MGANGPTVDPRCMPGRVYVGDHLTLRHAKYIS